MTGQDDNKNQLRSTAEEAERFLQSLDDFLVATKLLSMTAQERVLVLFQLLLLRYSD